MDEWKELIQDFLNEAFSLLDNLEESLLSLEKNLDDPSQIATVFRVAHTIKGGAGAVGFDAVTKLTHIMEDVLDLVRNGKCHLTQDDISLLLSVRDELESLLNQYSNNETPDPSRSQKLMTQLESIKIRKNDSSTNNNQSDTPSKQTTNSEDNHEIDSLPLSARLNLTFDLLESLEESIKNNEYLVIIEIKLNETYELRDVSALEILAIVNRFAEPIIMNPTIELLDDEFFPYLNMICTTTEKIDYIQKKLTLPDVVTHVSVKQFNNHVFEELADSMMYNRISSTKNMEQNVPFANAQEKAVALSPDTQKTDTSLNPVINTDQKTEKKNLGLKIESSRIDELLNLLGELVIIRSGFNQFELNLDKALQNIRYSLRDFLNSSHLLHLNKDEQQNALQNTILRNSYLQISNGLDNYTDYVQQFSRISGILQHKMMSLRMIPIQTVFSRFSRLTRDIGKQLNKKIELIISGGETEIDKGIIDDLYDPLMHMIRNSLDHGIELPEDRLKAGKSEIGTITLHSYQEGDLIFIELDDDGKGIDTELLKRKAIDKKFITPEQAHSLSEEEALRLIFMPGFSTANEISDLSGRGVGMDVVIRNIESIGGSVSVHSKIGEGSKFIIKLPLTLAIIQGLLIYVENIHYIIPIIGVEETVILDPTNLHRLNRFHALKFREKLIPLIDLPNVLYGATPFYETLNEKKKDFSTVENISEHVSTCYCIIIKYGNRQVGIIAPDILGEQDIVIKPMDRDLIYSPGISAATIVGNGEIGFILDIPTMIQFYLNNK
ncbi:MAG: chemotaxis protein CheA, partial [Brevinema sp.]